MSLTRTTPPQPSRTLGDLPDVDGFVKVGDVAAEIVDVLADQAAAAAEGKGWSMLVLQEMAKSALRLRERTS